MNKPKIELKSIKHHAGLSQETHAYTATIYVDGKRWGSVENSGHGGSDLVHPFGAGKGQPSVHELIAQLNGRIKETYPKWEGGTGKEYDTDLEIVCGDLVNDFLLKREFKKVMRRICFVKAGEEGLYQLPAKIKPNLENMVKVRNAPWAEGAIFLHDLTEEEAFEIFKKQG